MVESPNGRQPTLDSEVDLDLQSCTSGVLNFKGVESGSESYLLIIA